MVSSISLISIIKKHFLLITIFILAIALRLYSVEGNSIVFWYDQARDLTTVQSIIQNKDIKIQGPSASGTNDSLYHGVFYYYLIVPAVAFSNGDPQVIANYLAIIGSFSVFVIYYLSVTIFKSKKVGLLSAFLLAVSFINIQQATWLSNPQTLVITVGLFYVLVWKIFFDKPSNIHFIALGVFLGLCVQSGFFELYLVGTLISAYLLKVFQTKKLVQFKILEIVSFMAVFLITISTMILTEFLLLYHGILSLSSLHSIRDSANSSVAVLAEIVLGFFQNLQTVVAPHSYLLFFISLLIPLVLGFKNISKNQQTLMIIICSAPLWLFLVQYRASVHLFSGLELIYYVLLSVGLLHIHKNIFKGKVISGLLLSLFVVCNILALVAAKSERTHYFSVQQGALLSEQLALIDTTYKMAEGTDFTFSSSTNPYGINVTWSYLYNWYGKNKYGYVPHFVGDPQAGLIGAGTLPESNSAYQKHFTIIEPHTGLEETLQNIFLLKQLEKSSTSSAELEFGSLRLEVRSNPLSSI